MTENDTIDRHAEAGWKMLKGHHDLNSVEAHFKNEGLPEELVEAVMKAIRKKRHTERSQYGTIMLIAGVLLLGIGFFSCVTLTHGGASSLDFALYGLTTIGAIIVIVALVFIFH
jgi:hypothetical protein